MSIFHHLLSPIEISDIYSTLLLTYNATLLNKYSRFIQQQILTYVITKKNNVLRNLIKNLFNFKSIDVNYLNGTGELYYFTKDDMKIYLFADQTHDLIGCKNTINTYYMNIQNYLQYILKNSSCFIDLYLELPLFETRKYSAFGPLHHLHNKFIECFSTINQCNLNGRLHQIDIRTLCSKYTYPPFLNMINIIFNHNSDFFKQPTYIEQLLNPFHQPIIDKLCEITTLDDLISILITDIHNFTVLQKEFEKSFLDKNELIEWVTHQLRRSTVNHIIHTTSNFEIIKQWFIELKKTKKITSFIILHYYIVNRILQNLATCYIDLYTLARMFKIFNIKDYVHHPSKITNIIYVGGSYHTNVLKDYLTDHHFTLETVIYSDEVNCLPIKQIHPLFNK